MTTKKITTANPGADSILKRLDQALEDRDRIAVDLAEAKDYCQSLFDSCEAKDARIAELEAALEKAKKDTESANSTKDMWYRNNNEKEQELEQLHALLDGLDGALPRTVKKDGCYSETKVCALTRLASWLGRRTA